MALDPKAQAALALHRFGVGPRAGSIAAIASDPRGALLAELDRPGAGRVSDADLLTSGAAARVAFAYQQAQRAARQAERAAQPATAPGSGGAPEMKDQTPPASAPRPNPGPSVPQQIYLAEAKARIHAALATDIGFVERLVWFWSNHFCVSADKGNVRQICGAYEREVIRANVLGRFGDMLLAAESHPAMLIYLDNARSIGPDSMAGLRQKRGLNENLAREILELHTLGVRTVYTQDDVTRFANVITGWTVVPFRQDALRGGEFDFNPRMHQPGAQTVIGKSYSDGGLEQGRAVLATLARHPATAKHVATKLARHFVADEPPPGLVDRLAKRFLATQGDLKEVGKALVAAPESWEAPRAKLKRPGEWVVAALRAVGVTPAEIGPVMQAHNLLGEPLWRPSAPKGFADESAPWLDGLAQRLDIANQFARRLGAEADPRDVFEEALAPLASAETRQAITRAESRPQALALLFMAPEFQRR
ncbi:MAG: hypothetical protein AUI16_23110 [Alphaproteobacteria bacterium 13_2_20CM_2_64_7]|jgi:uncharacterized protein (DUF1800 family)|nr:MAG: hypothetical protein AUI16_23110 [Alphaproteobacteria bacterium 13_2_20CM_2_64_7]